MGIRKADWKATGIVQRLENHMQNDTGALKRKTE